MIKTVSPPRRLRGEVRLPGDKSITHRAFVLNAIALGSAIVRNPSRGEDCLSTLHCLRSLGATIDADDMEAVRIEGRGPAALEPAAGPLDAGNSGTTVRLISGVLAGLPFTTVITGDNSLRNRPMHIAEPLGLMGAQVSGSNGDSKPPLEIHGGSLHGIDYQMPVVSAQIKSCILIAGLGAEGETVVQERLSTRDHTERMLGAMGARIETQSDAIRLQPGTLRAQDVDVPGDISAASFWLVAGALHPDAEILVRSVGLNPSRTGMLDALAEMGADLTYEDRRSAGGEEVADIRVRSSELRGVAVSGAMVPRMIDELQLLALAGACATGTTEIREAAELRSKESDRVSTIVEALRAFGVEVEELPDGLRVQGGGPLQGAAVSSNGDHRLAMVLAVAGLIAQGSTVIQGAEAVGFSYPDFWDDLELLTEG
jgi:3-phosphoshikimate 1-carboxyvinyltransferase